MEKSMQVQESNLSIDCLQFLRFIAFILVFLVHGNIWCFWGFPSHGAGAHAVSFFILLSGMMTGYTGYGREFQLSGRNISRFMWKKLKKLYPLYLWTVVFSLLWSEIPMGIAVHDLDSISHNVPTIITAPSGIVNPNWDALIDGPKQLCRNLLLIQAWFEKGHFSYNGSSWFLSTLMFLYLLSMPLLKLIQLIDKHPNRRWLLGGLLAISLVGTAIYCRLLYKNSFYTYTFPPARIGEFTIGMVLGYIIRRRKLPSAARKTTLFTLLEIVALANWFATCILPPLSWTGTILHWLPSNLFLLIVFSFEKGLLSRIFSCKLLKQLGDISFECYLLHYPVFSLYLEHTGIDGTISKTGSLFSLFMCLFLTVFLASLIHRGKEHSSLGSL